MATKFNEVHDVLQQLHKSGVINLDKSVNDMLASKESFGKLSPGGEVATSVIAWDGYGVVIRSQQSDLSTLSTIAEQLKSMTGK